MKRMFYLFPRKRNDSSRGKDKGVDGKAKVAMFSDFFSNVNDNLFVTNGLYAGFKEQVLSSIDVYSPKVAITMHIYETKQSSEFNRDFLTLGFKKYVEACFDRTWREYISELVHVTMFALIGVLIIFLGFFFSNNNPDWVTYIITNFGTVLIWQFVGFWAFQFSGYKKDLDRLKQMETIKFEFMKWE